MKKKVILILSAVILISLGLFLQFFGQEGNKNESEKTKELKPVEGYQILGGEKLKEDKMFDGIKYTLNHLSFVKGSSTSFSSKIFNETKEDISHKDIKLDFYDQYGNLLGSIMTHVEELKNQENTFIVGFTDDDLTEAYDFVASIVSSEE